MSDWRDLTDRVHSSSPDQLARLDVEGGETFEPTATLVQVGNRPMPLLEFLTSGATAIAAHSNGGGRQGLDELGGAFRTFVRAGLQALTARSMASDWVQIGIALPTNADARCELCQRIAELVRRLLGESAIENFFFMHKAPGMRLRFEKGPHSGADLIEHLYQSIGDWREEGLIAAIEPGIYEPESQLFGGAAAMAYVHALFTIDSLIWLDYHARSGAAEQGDIAWLASLAMLPPVFQGLGITGWEDMGVWQYLRERTGRDLDQASLSLAEYEEVAKSMRAIWLRRDVLLEQLPPDIHAIVSDHYPGLHAAATQWHSGYFATSAASTGPRSAVAFYIIFHWNRAGLSAVQQALLTETLSKPER